MFVNIVYCMVVISINLKKIYQGEEGWRSGENPRLSPMWRGFDSSILSHMWVEFVVGSLLALRGFSPGTVVTFPLSDS